MCSSVLGETSVLKGCDLSSPLQEEKLFESTPDEFFVLGDSSQPANLENGEIVVNAKLENRSSSSYVN